MHRENILPKLRANEPWQVEVQSRIHRRTPQHGRVEARGVAPRLWIRAGRSQSRFDYYPASEKLGQAIMLSRAARRPSGYSQPPQVRNSTQKLFFGVQA